MSDRCWSAYSLLWVGYSPRYLHMETTASTMFRDYAECKALLQVCTYHHFITSVIQMSPNSQCISQHAMTSMPNFLYAVLKQHSYLYLSTKHVKWQKANLSNACYHLTT